MVLWRNYWHILTLFGSRNQCFSLNFLDPPGCVLYPRQSHRHFRFYNCYPLLYRFFYPHPGENINIAGLFNAHSQGSIEGFVENILASEVFKISNQKPIPLSKRNLLACWQ